MISFSRILCPIDTSEFSRRALSHALALGRWYGASVTAVHVRPRSVRPAGWGEEASLPVLEGLLEEPDLDAAIRRLVADVAGADRVAITMRTGGVVQEVLTLAAEVRADLIVIGTHGAGGFERLMMGSVAEKLLRKAYCPVLTVPRAAAAAAKAVQYRTIVCGVDFSPVSLRALDYALSLAQESQARLLITHVFEQLAPEHRAALAARFDVAEYERVLEAAAAERLAGLVPAPARAWCEPQTLVRHGKPHRALVELAREEGADLLVLGALGRGPVEAALFGSTTSHVVREAPCPVLTVTAQGESHPTLRPDRVSDSRTASV